MAPEGVRDFNDEDDTSFQSLHRPSKRRKLNSPEYSTDTESGSTGADGSFASFDTVAPDNHGAENKENEDGDKSKPKTRFKIHIPKNSELPGNTFFTQPPQRSSSPYRIDQFHWLKPRKPSSPPTTGQRGHVKLQLSEMSPADAVPTGTSKYAGEDNRDRSEANDEFEFDESYDDLLADLPPDAFSTNKDSVGGPRDTIVISSHAEYPSQTTMPHHK